MTTTPRRGITTARKGVGTTSRSGSQVHPATIVSLVWIMDHGSGGALCHGGARVAHVTIHTTTDPRAVERLSTVPYRGVQPRETGVRTWLK